MEFEARILTHCCWLSFNVRYYELVLWRLVRISVNLRMEYLNALATDLGSRGSWEHRMLIEIRMLLARLVCTDSYQYSAGIKGVIFCVNLIRTTQNRVGLCLQVLLTQLPATKRTEQRGTAMERSGWSFGNAARGCRAQRLRSLRPLASSWVPVGSSRRLSSSFLY